uniref:Ice-binding protein 4 n=1 Tax=Chloromonas brevispina TaxID=201318 RepID=A0A060KUT8_9CHLO|nr:ice-binding protein 4 [Chloromonas brevispina]
MAQSMLVVLCAVLALNGVVGRQLRADTVTCTTGCSNYLQSAAQFGVLGGQMVQNVGATTIYGSLAVFPGDQASGFPPGNVTGTQHIYDPVASQAHDDAITAYNTLAGMVYNGTDDFTGQDLGRMVLTPGKYFWSSGAQLTGNVTFDAQGNSSAIFVIQTGSTFVTSDYAQVKLANGAKSCNVYFVVGSSATLSQHSVIRAIVIASASVTVENNVVVRGNVVALHASVTLKANTIVASTVCGSHHPTA